MTIALSPATVASSIASLSISGVTIQDLSTIPQTGQMVCPIMFPQPDGFITDTTPETQSFGSNGGASIDFSYTLHYVFLFTEHGTGLSQLDPYSPLIAKLELILETILNNDAVTGLIDMKLAGMDAVGVVEDPAGNKYWGALFSLRCLEFAQ